jgi:1-acyl-sn-glycerol-3-phosphate acyltransferase
MKSNPDKTNGRFTIPFPIIRLLSLLLMKPFFQLEIQGREHFENLREPVIFAGNHTGYLDSLIVAAAIKRPFTFLMSEEVFSWKGVGKLVPYGNTLPLNMQKPLACFRETLNLLAKKHSICIFPEGKLTLDGRLAAFNPGVAFLQEKSKAPVIPFAIRGGFDAWAIDTPRPVFGKIVIEFGEPIFPQIASSREDVTALIKSKVQSLLDAEAQVICHSRESGNLTLSNSIC